MQRPVQHITGHSCQRPHAAAKCTLHLLRQALLQALLRFQINRERERERERELERELEREAQTVQTYSKRSRQSAWLVWKWKWNQVQLTTLDTSFALQNPCLLALCNGSGFLRLFVTGDKLCADIFLI